MTEKTGVIGGLDLPEKAEQSRRIIVIIIIFGTPNPYNVPREQEYSVELIFIYTLKQENYFEEYDLGLIK